MNVEEFLRDPGSTTGYFNQLSLDYRLDILQHGINGECFERIIAIYLNSIPCLVAISRTKINFPLFLDILQNAGHIPIGTRLFAPNSSIKRENLNINPIFVDDIENLIIANFISTITTNDKKLYCRTSDFTFEDQMMHLDEYTLPGLTKILNKTTL